MRTFGRAYRFEVEIVNVHETVTRETWTVHALTFQEAINTVQAEAPLTVKLLERAE